MTLREAGQLYIIVLLQYFDIHEILAHLNEKDAMLIIMTMLWAAKTVSYAMSITLWHLTYWSFTPLIKTAFIHEANHNSATNYDYVMNTSSCRTLLFKAFHHKNSFHFLKQTTTVTWKCSTVGHLQLFQNKMRNARGRGWARWELTKPLRSKYAKEVGTCTVKTRSH